LDINTTLQIFYKEACFAYCYKARRVAILYSNQRAEVYSNTRVHNLYGYGLKNAYENAIETKLTIIHVIVKTIRKQL